MGKLYQDGIRPEDIKLDNVNVNEVYCDGILVWKRLVSNNIPSEDKYLETSSTITWKANDVSNETVMYSWSSSTANTNYFDIDLTSIPTNATIISAVLSWDYARTFNKSEYKLGTTSTNIYFQNHQIGKISDKEIDCTQYVTPGAVNQIGLYYKQNGANFSTANNGSTYSVKATYTMSNVFLAISYQV